MKGNNPSDPYEHCAGSDVELHRPCGRIVQAKGNKYFAIGRNIKFWRDFYKSRQGFNKSRRDFNFTPYAKHMSPWAYSILERGLQHFPTSPPFLGSKR